MKCDGCGSGLCCKVWGCWVGVGGRLCVVCGHILGPCWPILTAMLPQLEVMGAQLGARLAKLGTMLAHPAAYVALFKPMLACGLGGLGLVGRGLCVKVWGWWGGVGQ